MVGRSSRYLAASGDIDNPASMMKRPSMAVISTANAWESHRTLYRNNSVVSLNLDLDPEQENPGLFDSLRVWLGRVSERLGDLRKEYITKPLLEGKNFYLRPSSRNRRRFTVVLLLAITYQAVLIPLRVTWEFKYWREPAWLVMDVLCDLIFLLDMAAKFITAFPEDGTGKIIADRRLMAHRYLTKGFLSDLVASLPLDLLALHLGADWLAVLRLPRLLRTAQFFELFGQLEKGIQSGILRIFRLFFLMFVCAHWFGCLWFLIARLENFNRNTWAYADGVVDSSFQTQYIISVYWSLTVMTTVGFGDVTPGTDSERLFAMLTMITGVSLYATIFGNMATLIASLDSSQQRYAQKLDTLREYMRYRALPSYLKSRILTYYEVIWSRGKGLDENAILTDMPKSLRSEIALYLNRELVENVPLFRGTNEPGFINSLVVMLKPQVALAGDYIIRHGEIGREMYFVSRGEVEVVSGDGSTVFAILKEGSYFGEIALLFAARRIASIRALCYCDLLMLTKDDFDSVLGFFPKFADSMRAIAKQKIEDEREKRPASARSDHSDVSGASHESVDSDSSSSTDADGDTRSRVSRQSRHTTATARTSASRYPRRRPRSNNPSSARMGASKDTIGSDPPRPGSSRTMPNTARFSSRGRIQKHSSNRSLNAATATPSEDPPHPAPSGRGMSRSSSMHSDFEYFEAMASNPGVHYATSKGRTRRSADDSDTHSRSYKLVSRGTQTGSADVDDGTTATVATGADDDDEFDKDSVVIPRTESDVFLVHGFDTEKTGSLLPPLPEEPNSTRSSYRAPAEEGPDGAAADPAPIPDTTEGLEAAAARLTEVEQEQRNQDEDKGQVKDGSPMVTPGSTKGDTGAGTSLNASPAKREIPKSPIRPIAELQGLGHTTSSLTSMVPDGDEGAEGVAGDDDKLSTYSGESK